MADDSTDLFGALFGPASGSVKPGNSGPTIAVPVLVPMPAPGPYSYGVPEDMVVEPGSIVQVPLGPRQVIGVVWDKNDGPPVDPKKLRPITKTFDCPPLREEMRRFIDWVASYTLSPPGLVAKMALRAPAAFDPEPMVEGLRLTEARPERLTPARERVIELAGEGHGWTRSGLAHAAGVSTSVVEGLAKQGVFETVFLPAPPVVAEPDPDYAPSRLEGPQKQAASEFWRMCARVALPSR